MSWDSTVSGLSPSYWWKLGESSGTTAADSASTDTGTYPGSGVTYGVTGPITSDSPNPTCVTLSGTTVPIETATSLTIPTSAFSVGVWFKTSTKSQAIVAFDNAKAGTSFTETNVLYLDSNGYLNWYTYTNAAVQEFVTGSTNLADGNWHFAVGVYSSTGTIALYVDGSSVGTPISAPGSGFSFTGYWCLGAGHIYPSQTMTYFAGSLAQVMVWSSTALTSTNVSSLYSSATSSGSGNETIWNLALAALTNYSPTMPVSPATGNSTAIGAIISLECAVETVAASPVTVTGLTDGTPYSFSVAATNSAGTGSFSSPSNSVTPSSSGVITTNGGTKMGGSSGYRPPSTFFSGMSTKRPANVQTGGSALAQMKAWLTGGATIVTNAGAGAQYGINFYPVPVGQAMAPLSGNTYWWSLEGTTPQAPLPQTDPNSGQTVTGPGGGDGSTVCYYTDGSEAWELNQLRNLGNGTFSIGNGGYYVPSSSHGQIPGGHVFMAASALADMPLETTYADAQIGVIQHPLAIAVPSTGSSPYGSPLYPAQYSDMPSGENVMGGWFFFPKAGYDTNWAGVTMPSGMTQMGQMLFRAIQDYGMIITDSTGSSGDIGTGSESTPVASGQTDPVTAACGGNVGTSFVTEFSRFPWSQLQQINPSSSTINWI